jgi:cytosine/adenosine deaminase-related metal-dependent hydrolase
MPSSLIRGKYVICKVEDRHQARVIADGAVFQRDGGIVEVGPYAELAARHPGEEVIGSGGQVVIPGLVNAHHHVGLTPVQQGSPDHPLELWFASRIGARTVDLYLDTLYSAFEMIESGITTVQHLHSRGGAGPEAVITAADSVIRAYQDIGMRVSYAYGLRDQNYLVYGDDEAFLASLPEDVAPGVAEVIGRQRLSAEDYFAVFEDLHGRHAQHQRVRIQLAPANLHWCSDRALAMAKECAEKFGVPLHMHILETAFQKEYARRRTGKTAIRFLHDEFELLGPSFTMGHGVWLTEEDIELAAETGTCICHNCSSNLRLRSGVAALNEFERHHMRVAIGLDEAGINDDRDMLQEMRLVLKLHRTPGMDDSVPTSEQVLRMASEHGAYTTPYGTEIGTLEPGRSADMSLIDWESIAHPYLDLEQGLSVVDALVHRTKASGVETVIVAGEPIYRDGRFTRVNKEEILEELAHQLRAPLTDVEKRQRETARRVFPYVKRFYDGYLEGETREPFYKPSSRV